MGRPPPLAAETFAAAATAIEGEGEGMVLLTPHQVQRLGLAEPVVREARDK